MARNLFGGSSDDYAVDPNGRPLPNRRIRFYTSAAITTEITDLASDAAGTGTPLTVITDGHGFWGKSVPVYGPDGVTVMYAGAADGAGNPPTYVVAVYTHTPGGGGVSTFNTRTGDIALLKADVTGTGLAAADIGADATGAAATVQTNLTTEITRAQAAEAALGGGMQFRTAVVVATTNQALTGLPTVDGVTLTAGQVILLTAQSTGSQNGLWAVASGAWARPANFAAGLNATATSVLVESGTTGAGTTYAVTGTTNNVVGTNVLTFVKTSGSAASVTSAIGRVAASKDAVSRPKMRTLQTKIARIRPTVTVSTITTGIGVDTTTLAYTPNSAGWVTSYGPVGFLDYGSGKWADYDPYNAGGQSANRTIEFCTDAPLFALQLEGGGALWSLHANDELIAGYPLDDGTLPGSFHKIIDWGGVRAPRRYKLRLSTGATIKQMVTTTADSAWAPASDDAVYMGWMGDSYSQGQTTRGGLYDTIPALVARMLGWRPVISAAGGTGYSQPAGDPGVGNPGSFELRVPFFTSLDTRGYLMKTPDVMVLAGGHNNVGVDATTMQARVTGVINSLIAGGMTAGRIVVLGVLDQGGTWHSGTYVPVNAGMQAAAVATGALWVPNPGWITGTGYQGSRTVTDAVANSTTTVTSATAAFTAADVGSTVTAANMTTNPTTYIASVTNSTTAILNQAWSTSGSGKTLTITNQKRDGNADVLISTDATHPSPSGVEFFAARIAEALTGAF